jgi:heme-degrading monooxygenase HmoA
VILEQALLTVRPGMTAAFEAAFVEAEPLVAGMRGFRRLSLSRGLEDDATYLLLIEWDTLEDHTVGFRGSPEYQEWRRLLHSFYDPFPPVLHFRPVLTSG